MSVGKRQRLVKTVIICYGHFVIIMQNVNMTTNGKCNCRLNTSKRKPWSQHGYNILYAYVLVVFVSLVVDITVNLDEIISFL